MVGRGITMELLTYALLIVATVGLGFGGRPWVAFTVGVAFIGVLAILEYVDILKHYRGQPKTDIVLALMVKASIAIVGMFASAGTGYGLRLLLFR
jgi:hypothetical protein